MRCRALWCARCAALAGRAAARALTAVGCEFWGEMRLHHSFNACACARLTTPRGPHALSFELALATDPEPPTRAPRALPAHDAVFCFYGALRRSLPFTPRLPLKACARLRPQRRMQRCNASSTGRRCCGERGFYTGAFVAYTCTATACQHRPPRPACSHKRVRARRRRGVVAAGSCWGAAHTRRAPSRGGGGRGPMTGSQAGTIGSAERIMCRACARLRGGYSQRALWQR